MHSHVAHEIQPEPILSLCLWDSVWAAETQRCGRVSAGLSVHVWERRISWDEGEEGGAVNLSSTCSVDSGAWCEVSSARYPIDHIYYIHHSASLFWQLIAPGKEKERIGFLFEGRGILWAWAWVFACFFSARGLRRVIDVGSNSRLKPQLLQNDILSTVLETFWEK